MSGMLFKMKNDKGGKRAMQFPVPYFERNLAFSPDRRCWSVYKVNGFQYDFLSTSSKKANFRKLLGFFWNLERKCRILFLPKVKTYEEHYERLKQNASGPFLPYVEFHADQTKDWLEDLFGKEGSKYELYVCVHLHETESLMNQIKNFRQFIKHLIQEPKRKTEEVMGVSGLELYEDEIRLIAESEDRLYRRLHSFLSLEKVNEQDIEWIIRRNFWKGIGKPPQRFLWQESPTQQDYEEDAEIIKTHKRAFDFGTKRGRRVIRSRRSEFLPLTEGNIEKYNRRMLKISQVIEDEEVSSYTSCLTISDLPDNLYIPGNEWLYQLHDLDFPVAVSMFVEPMSTEDAKAKLRNKKMDIDDQTEHTASATDVPIRLQESKSDAMILEKDLDDNKFPMFDMTCVFEVVGSTPTECAERVDALRDYYKGNHIELVNPAGEQWKLFNEFFPAGERLCSIDYIQRVSPHVLAASMVAATKRLGDDQGHLIGFTGVLNQPVFFDPAQGPLRNMSGSGAFIGTLGGGKSFTANFIATIVTTYGAKALFFDPKEDRKDWDVYLPELAHEIEYVKLSNNEEDYGKLDPWGMFEDDVDEAARLSVDIITFLTGIKTHDEELTYLTEAVERVKLLKERSMMAIIKELENIPEDPAKKLARQLRAFTKMAYAKLLFHDGPLNSINTNRRITILQVANLNLPEHGTPLSDYDTSNYLSVAMMFSIGAFAKKFAEEDPNEFTVVVLDEFWAISSTKEGQRLTKRLIRTGRSFFAAIFLISQNADDLLDESIKNNLGFKFVFRSGDPNEVRKILQFMDLEETEENISIVQSLGTGRPLFKDLDGNVGIVNIETVFDHYAQAFDTTPGKKKEVS